MLRFQKFVTQSRLAQSGLGVLASVTIWLVLSKIIRSPEVFPGPVVTVQAAAELLSIGYWRDFAATSARAAAGWSAAMIAGVPLGLCLGLAHVAYGLSRPVLSFLRSLPAFMLITIPVAAGYGGEVARLLTVAVASGLIIVDECAESMATAPRDRLEILQVNRASFWFILTRLLLFESLGRVVVPAARTTVGISFIVAVVAESLVIPQHGVGARLLTSLAAFEMDFVYGFLLLTGIAGVLLNAVIHATARRVVYWS